jgi:hypothetical protein
MPFTESRCVLSAAAFHLAVARKTNPGPRLSQGGPRLMRQTVAAARLGCAAEWGQAASDRSTPPARGVVTAPYFWLAG